MKTTVAAMSDSNIQTWVVMVKSPKGAVWPIATNTQRGFTGGGADRAADRVAKILPKGWECWVQELTPLDQILAMKH